MLEVVSENADAPIPDSIAKAPELFEGSFDIWRAFATLSQSRTYNFSGSNPLQVSEILAYFEMFGISDFEEREELVYLIKELDSEFLKDEANRRPKK